VALRLLRRGGGVRRGGVLVVGATTACAACTVDGRDEQRAGGQRDADGQFNVWVSTGRGKPPPLSPAPVRALRIIRLCTTSASPDIGLVALQLRCIAHQPRVRRPLRRHAPRVQASARRLPIVRSQRSGSAYELVWPVALASKDVRRGMPTSGSHRTRADACGGSMRSWRTQ
jgi:hypothetical protein